MKFKNLLEIRTSSDIEHNLPYIKNQLSDKQQFRLPHIKYELEIELGFHQQDHIIAGGALNTFTGIKPERISQVIESTLKTSPHRYPKNIIQQHNTKENENITQIKENENEWILHREIQ